MNKQLLRRGVEGVWVPGMLRLLGQSGKTSESLNMTAELHGVDQASQQHGARAIDLRRPCMWIRTDAESTAITISGEIGASDIDNMSPYARGLVRDCGVLIVDLSGTGFIAVDALRALFALWSAGAATTGPTPAHVMRICSERMTVELRRGE